MVDFKRNVMSPFFLLRAAWQNVTADCFYRTDMIKSVYDWQGQSPHPNQLYRLHWQWQAHPQDYGGQGEQEGAK